MKQETKEAAAEEDMKKHTIDLDAAPKLPEWATLVEHRKGGTFEWDPSKLDLFLADEQKNGYIYGNQLCEKLKNEPVLNVNLANFLVEHPKLYPKEWRGKYVHFWGTIVLHRDVHLLVPYLIGDGGGVVLHWRWLGYGWHSSYPALRFASSSALKPSGKPLDSLPLDLEARVEKLEEFEEKVRKFLII